MKPAPQKNQKSTRFFSLILITLAALFFAVACGPDNDDDDGNNAGNPVITLTYNDQTTTTDLNGFGTSMPVSSPLVIGTNVYLQAGDDTPLTTSLILHNPSEGKVTTGQYTIYKEGEEPGDDKPFAWMLLTGATTLGLPSALEAVSGTIKLESLKEHDFLLGSADYTFTATFHDIHENDDIAYQVSGTVKHTNKLPESD